MPPCQQHEVPPNQTGPAHHRRHSTAQSTPVTPATPERGAALECFSRRRCRTQCRSPVPGPGSRRETRLPRQWSRAVTTRAAHPQTTRVDRRAHHIRRDAHVRAPRTTHQHTDRPHPDRSEPSAGVGTNQPPVLKPPRTGQQPGRSLPAWWGRPYPTPWPLEVSTHATTGPGPLCATADRRRPGRMTRPATFPTARAAARQGARMAAGVD